jgi:hypothetical protein
MFDELRKPFFIAALVVIALAVLLELGAGFFVGAATDARAESLYTISGIFYLGVLDALVLFTILLVGAPLVITHRLHGRIQGVVTFVFSLLMLLGSIVMIFGALALLLLMVSLLLAIPFGTVIYLAEYGDFNRAAAAATLSFAMALKLGFSVLLVLAHQRFLENKGLVLIVLTSFAGTILLSFLHGFFPRFLVSITDDVGAIIIAVLTLIWALFYLIGAIPAILKALRVDKSAA